MGNKSGFAGLTQDILKIKKEETRMKFNLRKLVCFYVVVFLVTFSVSSNAAGANDATSIQTCGTDMTGTIESCARINNNIGWGWDAACLKKMKDAGNNCIAGITSLPQNCQAICDDEYRKNIRKCDATVNPAAGSDCLDVALKVFNENCQKKCQN